MDANGRIVAIHINGEVFYQGKKCVVHIGYNHFTIYYEDYTAIRIYSNGKKSYLTGGRSLPDRDDYYDHYSQIPTLPRDYKELSDYMQALPEYKPPKLHRLSQLPKFERRTFEDDKKWCKTPGLLTTTGEYLTYAQIMELIST